MHNIAVKPENTLYILFNPGIFFAELLNQLASLLFSFRLYLKLAYTIETSQDSKRTVQVNNGQV